MNFFRRFINLFSSRGKNSPLSFYRELIPAGSLCFDIGANEGKKTVTLLSVPARVVAVEPNEKLCQELRKKFGGRATIVSLGVAESKGRKKFFRSNQHEVSTFSEEFIRAFSFQEFLKWDGGTEVETTTLDFLIQQYGAPFFIKIDTEGFEEKVLSGLSEKVPLIEFEYTAPFAEMALRCIEKLSKTGNYSFNFSDYESYSLRYGSWLPPDEMKNQTGILKETVKHGNVFARLVKD